MISLALAFTLLNSLLALWGTEDIQLYYIANLVAFLIITLLYVYLNPRARGALSVLTLIFFSGFAVIVVFKILDVLKL
jgi:uncharacterized membrane protein YhhN